MRTAKVLKPWRHQRQAQLAITVARESGKHAGLMVMATGLGKNLTAALEYEKFRRSMLRRGKRSRLLFLAHQSHMLDQARETYEMRLGRRISCGMFNDVFKETKADAVFATFQSMDKVLFGKKGKKRRPFGRHGFDYVIIDESHHSHAHTYRRVIRYFKPRFTLAMTATPDRADLQDIRDLYGPEVYSLPLEEGLARGLLAPVDYRLVTDGLHKLSILDTPIGRLSVKRLNKTLFIPRRDAEIAKIILQHARRQPDARMMIFCPSIKYCTRLERHLPNAVAIHSRLTDKEQADRQAKFRTGDYTTVLTVDKFNEGIDIPEANIIVFLRSTASRRIFLQQLGRGLRKLRGKRNVLVLDFAANCERLQMVNTLWRSVDKIKRQSAGKTKDRAVSVDIGKVKFSHVAQRILDVLGRIQEGYTREVIIAQLRSLGKHLDRTPMTDDIREASKKGLCANPTTILRHFGTLHAALKAAGFRPTRGWGATEDEVKLQIKAVAKALGHTPTIEELRAAWRKGDIVHEGVIRRIFGTVTAAFEAVGLVTRKPKHYTTSEIKKQLKEIQRTTGKAPTRAEITNRHAAGKGPSLHIVIKRFGSFSKALLAIGTLATNMIKPVKGGKAHRKGEASNKFVLGCLKRLERSLGRIPSRKDVDVAARKGLCLSSSTYAKRFGSLTAAKKAAGIEIVVEVKRTRKQHIRDLKRLAKKLGRTPFVEDVKAAYTRHECGSTSMLYKVFGSFNNALEEAGLTPNRIHEYTDQRLIHSLQELGRKLGRPPYSIDVNRASKESGAFPGLGPFLKAFGTFRKAREAAGFKA